MSLTRTPYLDTELWKVAPGSPLCTHVLDFLHTAWGTSNRAMFPGPQPVSIERRHFPVLSQQPYVVCEKTDGSRHVCVCTMFEDKKICVFVNRNQDMVLVPLNILRGMFAGTVLDGELVKGTGDTGWLYMVYDCVATAGTSCRSAPLTDRIAAAEVFVKGIMKLKKDPVTFRVKTLWPLVKFDEFEKETFPYGTDGIVLTPVNEPVRSGTHETMFKWKPRDSNTIDFMMKPWGPGVWGMYVQEKGKLILESQVSDLQLLPGTVDGSIVEAQYVHWETPRWWKPLGIRTDKTHPNNRRTFYRTLTNISENIALNEFKRVGR